MSGFGACRTLLHISFIHFAVILLSQLKHTLGLADYNALMSQPLSVFSCVVKAKSEISNGIGRKINVTIY